MLFRFWVFPDCTFLDISRVIPPLASHTRKGPERRAYKPQFRQKRKRSRSPAGPRRLRDSDAHKRIAVPKALCVLREHLPGKIPKAAKYAVLTPGPGMFVNVQYVSEGSDSSPVRNAPVSPCVPLCAIFLREPSVYPLSPVKANVGRLCEKLKNAMKSGLEQRCDGNFWTIFAGTILGEKPNFTGRFSEW